MAPQDYLIRYCGLSEGEAQAYLSRAKEYQQNEAALTLKAGGMNEEEEGGEEFGL
jgi:hypothetical protein